MTWTWKTFDFKFFWKIPGPCVRKNSTITWDWQRGEEKLDEGLSWSTTWNCSILIGWAIREAFADHHWPLRVFHQLSGFDLRSNGDTRDWVGKNFKGIPSLQVVNRRNLIKFLVTSQVDCFFMHGHGFFWEKLKIEDFHACVISSVYCSMTMTCCSIFLDLHVGILTGFVARFPQKSQPISSRYRSAHSFHNVHAQYLVLCCSFSTCYWLWKDARVRVVHRLENK